MRPNHSPGACNLLTLPNELLDHIFTFLDIAAPSERAFNGPPTIEWLHSDERNIKSISLLSHRLRAVVLNRLFTHVKVHPDSVDELLTFIRRTCLTTNVESIVIQIPHDFVSTGPSWWCLLFDKVPAQRIVIQCEPDMYSWIANLDMDLSDSWAFRIPCQLVEFCQHPNLRSQKFICNPETGLLAAKQWQSLSVNEGSSLAAYTSYEYFLKKPPSLLANLQHYLNILPPSTEPAAYQQLFKSSATAMLATWKMMEKLQTFSYIAIFPFYNHVDNVLKCVMKMKNLEKLFVKLCPEPGSTVLEDEIQAAKGHIDLNDPWNEYASPFHVKISARGEVHGSAC